MNSFELAARRNASRTKYGLGLVPNGGLGFTYYDLLDAAGRENCDPRDSACVARNTQRANAVEDLWISQYMTNPNTANMSTPPVNIKVDTSQPAVDSFMQNQPMTQAIVTYTPQNTTTPVSQTVQQLENTLAPTPVDTTKVVTPTPVVQNSNITPTNQQTQQTQQQVQTQVQVVSYSPKLSFTVSRSGDSFLVGDNWQISISGGKPGATVKVKGGLGGATDITPMGTIGSNGYANFLGVFGASAIGSWNETWLVDDVSIGTLTFKVSPVGSNVTGGSNNNPVQNTGGVIQYQSGGNMNSSGSGGSVTGGYSSGYVSDTVSAANNWLTESMVGGIPNWALVAGVGVGVIMFAQKGRR